jgi:hypothetical protein
MTKAGPAAGKVLDADDLSAMFGLDMAVAEPSPISRTKARPAKVPPRRKAKAKKPVNRRAAAKAG